MSNEDPKEVRSVEDLLGLPEEDKTPLHLVILGSTIRDINILIRAINISPQSPTKATDEAVRAKLLKPVEGLAGEDRLKAFEGVLETDLTRREVARVNEIFHTILSPEDIEIFGMSAADLGSMVGPVDSDAIQRSQRESKRRNFDAFYDFNSAIEVAGGVPDENYIHTGGRQPPTNQ